MADDRLAPWRPDCMVVEVVSTNAADPWISLMKWQFFVVNMAKSAIRTAACSSKAKYDGKR